MSQSSTSAAEFGAENLLRPLSQIRLGLKRSEEGQVPSWPAMLCDPAANQLQRWLELILGKLIDQLMEFLAHRAHRSILRLQPSVLRQRRPGQYWCWPAQRSRLIPKDTSPSRPDIGKLLDQTRPVGAVG